MSTLQRGICLGCIIIIAIAGAITAGVIAGNDAAPAGPSDALTMSANNNPAPRAEQPAATPAPTPKPTPRPKPQAQAQTNTPPATPKAQPPANQAGPPARIVPDTFDFGLKNPDNLIWTKFKVYNESDKPLYVREVKPACKCTVPTLDSDVIPPGGFITMDASIDLRGTTGNVKKSFMVYFNDYASPLKGNIVGELSYPVQVYPKPAISSFPGDLVGTLTLSSLEGEPFTVCAINGDKPRILHKNTNGAEPASEWRVMYDLSGLDVNTVPAVLVVETDHPGARFMSYKLSGAVLSRREIQWIKLWNQIFVDRPNIPLGVIPRGGYADFETSLMRPDHSKSAEVSFKSIMFPDTPVAANAAKEGELKLEIIDRKPVDGRPKEEMYTVRVHNNSTENKIITMPLYFQSDGVESRTWISARLVPSPEADTCTPAAN